MTTVTVATPIEVIPLRFLAFLALGWEQASSFRFTWEEMKPFEPHWRHYRWLPDGEFIWDARGPTIWFPSCGHGFLYWGVVFT